MIVASLVQGDRIVQSETPNTLIIDNEAILLQCILSSIVVPMTPTFQGSTTSSPFHIHE